MYVSFFSLKKVTYAELMSRDNDNIKDSSNRNENLTYKLHTDRLNAERCTLKYDLVSSRSVIVEFIT